jgi:hypothetical protein
MDCLSLSLGDDEREQLFGQVSSFRNHVSQELAGKSMKNPARAIVRSSASRKAIRFMGAMVGGRGARLVASRIKVLLKECNWQVPCDITADSFIVQPGSARPLFKHGELMSRRRVVKQEVGLGLEGGGRGQQKHQKNIRRAAANLGQWS